ncbi:MAG: hypothetical protein V4850_24860 [Myxococcota bacterium]
MNEHERRAFEREGTLAKVLIVVLLLAAAVPAIWVLLFLWAEAAPNI